MKLPSFEEQLACLPLLVDTNLGALAPLLALAFSLALLQAHNRDREAGVR